MKKYINAPDQKENDKAETNSEDTEIYNLNDREFKIAIIKKFNNLQDNTENSMSSGIKQNSLPKRLKL